MLRKQKLTQLETLSDNPPKLIYLSITTLNKLKLYTHYIPIQLIENLNYYTTKINFNDVVRFPKIIFFGSILDAFSLPIRFENDAENSC